MADAKVKINPSVVNRVHDSLHFIAEPCMNLQKIRPQSRRSVTFTSPPEDLPFHVVQSHLQLGYPEYVLSRRP
jgi:hypothetical protein